MYEELFKKLSIWKRRYGLSEIEFVAKMRGKTEATVLVFRCTRGEEVVQFAISSQMLRSVSDLSAMVGMMLKSRCREFNG